MKTTKIYYSRVFSLPSYENVKVGVEIELESGDTEEQAIEKGKLIVEKESPDFIEKQKGKERQEKLDTCSNILANLQDYTEVQIIEAAKFIKEHKELPF